MKNLKLPTDNEIRKKRLEIAEEFFNFFDGSGDMEDQMSDGDTDAGIAAACAHDGANRMGAWLTEKILELNKGINFK